jgi:hypothetical protein
MDNETSKDKEIMESVTDKINEMHSNGKLTDYEYKELMEFNFDDRDYDNNIDAFKKSYKERKPILCSEILLKIYDEHKSSFRKAVMLSDCFPDPLSYKYTNEVHEFCISILNRAFKLAKNRNYSDDLINELRQIFLALKVFHKNGSNNTDGIEQSEFFKYSLSEQIRISCLFLQDQNRLEEELRNQDLSKQDFVTGMEASVANRVVDNNPSMKLSIIDNFEGLLDDFDTLIRYLYYLKPEELQLGSLPEHGDISHLHIPSFEFIVHLSAQRVIYTEMWEKFKYSQWKLKLLKGNDEDVYVFEPKFLDEFRQHIIAAARRRYIMLSHIYSHQNFDSFKEAYEGIIKLSDKIDICNPETIYLLNQVEYNVAKGTQYEVICGCKSNIPDFYFITSFNGIKTQDIFNAFEFLQTISEIYKLAVYNVFDQDNEALYKYLCPILSMSELSHMFANFYNYQESDSNKILSCFLFDSNIGNSDIFLRPLLSIGSDATLFCPVLIQQMNLERIIEMLFLQYKINISPIGKEFENKLRSLLSLVPFIQVNTNKVEFKAYDEKDVEYDFIGMFEDHLLLWEFKAVTTPYSDKRLYECKKTIGEGICQIERRSEIIKHDWEKIKKLCNINLPGNPVREDKIIRLVVTNIFDFTSIKYNGIIVVDESTILRFFSSPILEINNVRDRKTIFKKRIWNGLFPTVKDFLTYLDDPVTTSPFNDCLEACLKFVERLEDDYPIAFVDQIVVKDPYRAEIEKYISPKKSNKNSRKCKRKKKKHK